MASNAFIDIFRVKELRQRILYTIMWLAFLNSGVHATVAGVLAAMTIPARTRIPAGAFLHKARRLLDCFAASMAPGQVLLANKTMQGALEDLETACSRASAPLPRIEHALHPWVSYGIMPLFALANAGVVLTGQAGATLAEPVSLGIFLGLFIGKQVGIFLACFAMFRLGLAALPNDLRLAHYYGASVLAGIGFTMSIFIAGLAFGGQPAIEAQAKVAILVTSTLAGALGYAILRRASRDG